MGKLKARMMSEKMRIKVRDKEEIGEEKKTCYDINVIVKQESLVLKATILKYFFITAPLHSKGFEGKSLKFSRAFLWFL